jgi:hypothetical protein
VINLSPKSLIFNCEKIVKKPLEEVTLKTTSKKIFKIEKYNKVASRNDLPKNLLLAFKE